MNMKYALSSILLCFSLFCLPSCNDNETPANTPDGEEVEEVIKSYDWQLEGKWEYASNNGNDHWKNSKFVIRRFPYRSKKKFQRSNFGNCRDSIGKKEQTYQKYCQD